MKRLQQTTLLVDTSRFKFERAFERMQLILWSRKLELVLRGKGLWRLVFGDESISGTDDEKSKASFERRKDVALTTILLSVDDSCIAPVIDERDPTVAWRTLKKIRQAVSDASIDSYLTKYQQIRMKENEGIIKVVNRLTQLENKLMGVRKPRDEK